MSTNYIQANYIYTNYVVIIIGDVLKDIGYSDSIGIIIITAAKSLEKAIDIELINHLGLTGSQWKVVAALGVKDGITQKAISDMIFLETPTVVPILDKMEKKGLIQRKADPQDRRNNMVFLTKKSKEMVEPLFDLILDFRKRISKNVSVKDLENTKNVIRIITKNANLQYEKSVEKQKKS